jgi:hypothetical protein
MGDFGFGSMKELREMDEEKDPLKLRRGDLDHIVDDVTSDEEEGRLVLDEKTLATMEIEIAEDKQRRKKLFAALDKEKEDKEDKERKDKEEKEEEGNDYDGTEFRGLSPFVFKGERPLDEIAPWILSLSEVNQKDQRMNQIMFNEKSTAL